MSEIITNITYKIRENLSDCEVIIVLHKEGIEIQRLFGALPSINYFPLEDWRTLVICVEKLLNQKQADIDTLRLRGK